jgi:hypothetical protein
MRIVTLFPPEYGFDQWNHGMYYIKMPNGKLMNMKAHMKYGDNWEILFKDRDIYLQEYTCSSGCGRSTINPPVLLIAGEEYDAYRYSEASLRSN